MNTRKSNVKKLRLPSAGNNNPRNGCLKSTSTISNFFPTETNTTELPNDFIMTDNSEPMPSPIEKLGEEKPAIKFKRVTRTKLSTFLPKDKRTKPKPISDFLTKQNSDDFETPDKNIKKAPKTKAKPRAKKQQKIKTAFLKNEELFSAVAAQHCIADNINPDEMQMALALSKSEAETNGTIIVDDEDKCTSAGEQKSIRDKLKKFGFRVAESEDYNFTAFLPLNRKIKWANKFTPLTLRNPKRQMEKVKCKVDEFLSTQLVSSDACYADENFRYSVKSENLLSLVAHDNKIIRSNESERVDLEEFYVLSLFQPSKTKPGNLLKDIRLIPGRDRSPVKTRCPLKGDFVIDPQLQSPAMKKSRYDQFVSSVFSLPCPDTNRSSSETLQHTIQPLPATISCLTSYEPEIITNTQCSTEMKVVPQSDPVNTVLSSENSMLELSATGKTSILNDTTSKSLSITMEFSTPSVIEMTPKPLMKSGDFLNSQLQFSTIRATSPDIFADSDVEMEADDCRSERKEDNSNCSSGGDHITNYEMFSSDEVKTFLETEGEANDGLHTIDLTQCESDTNSQQSDTIAPSISTQSYQEKSSADDLGTASEEMFSNSFKPFEEGHLFEKLTESRKSCFSFGSSASEELYQTAFSNRSFSMKEEDSIDLTQNDEVDGEHIFLSDDEINYSIWKADKSLHINGDEDVESQSDTIDHLRKNEPRNVSDEKHEFSFIDLVEDTKQPDSQGEEFEFNLKTNSNTSLDLLDLDLSKRSDFGIIEEQSPFKTPTTTPKKTPRKTAKKTPASIKCRRTLSESFIASPVKNLASVKRFSSSKKFYEFTKSDDDSLSDLDDIDKLIYGSPSKKAYRKPAGLDQLLTGTLSTTIDSPKKTETEPAKEFEFNGRKYLVRTANVIQKTHYEKIDERALLDQLYKFGLKPLKRKQAVKMLEYIYNQTHPLLVDETDIPLQILTQNCDENNTLGYDNEIRNLKKMPSKGVFKFNLKDCWGHILLSDIDFPIEIEDEQYIVQTNTSKKISTALLPFHIAWHNLIKSNKLLHEAILHYEPIELQEIYLFFKGLGYRYDPKELKYFFDSRSIIFRYDLNKSDPSAGTNRHERKKRSESNKIS